MNELKKARWCVYAKHEMVYGNSDQVLSRWRRCTKGHGQCYPSMLRRDGRKLRPLNEQLKRYSDSVMCTSFLPTKEFQELQAKVNNNEEE